MNAKEYIENIEKDVNAKAVLISTGPKAEDIIDLR